MTLTRYKFTAILEHEYRKNLSNSGCKLFLYLEYTPKAEGTETCVLTDGQRDKVMNILNAFSSKYQALFIAMPWDENNVGGSISAAQGFVHIHAIGNQESCLFTPFSDTNVRDSSLRDALQSELFKKI